MTSTNSITRTQQRIDAELNASFTVVLYAKIYVAPRRALHALSGSRKSPFPFPSFSSFRFLTLHSEIATPSNTSCQECTRLRSLFRSSINGSFTAEGISRVARLHEMHVRMSAARATNSNSNSENENGDKENAEAFDMENYEEGSE